MPIVVFQRNCSKTPLCGENAFREPCTPRYQAKSLYDSLEPFEPIPQNLLVSQSLKDFRRVMAQAGFLDIRVVSDSRMLGALIYYFIVYQV